MASSVQAGLVLPRAARATSIFSPSTFVRKPPQVGNPKAGRSLRNRSVALALFPTGGAGAPVDIAARRANRLRGRFARYSVQAISVALLATISSTILVLRGRIQSLPTRCAPESFRVFPKSPWEVSRRVETRRSGSLCPRVARRLDASAAVQPLDQRWGVRGPTQSRRGRKPRRNDQAVVLLRGDCSATR
ncbi:hypothetical protein ACVWW1_004327 [Bradyrhizobium sp. JR3.5]